MKDKGIKTNKTSLKNQIKELKQTENKLEDNHKKLQNEINGKNKEIHQKDILLDRIFSNTHILIAYLDCNFNFVQVNKTFASFNDKIINYYIGKNYFEIYKDDKHKKIFINVIETGIPYIAFEKHFNYNKKTGKKEIFWDWSLHPVIDNDGNAEGLILTLLDVTERVKAQKELEKAKEKLNQSKRLSDLGLLAATVAHELRNPLSDIQAALYNIERKKENAPIEKQIRTIERKIIDGERIISNLLTYTKIKIPNYQKVNIIDLLDDSINTVIQMFKDKSIKIIKKTSDDFINFIKIDPIQIKEVFNNILLNSYQAINEKEGLIEITAKTIDDMMELTITDNGTGIKKADLAKVFDLLITRESRGTGLGLSICREIIKLHDGKILIDSKINKGTKIIIRLPYPDN